MLVENCQFFFYFLEKEVYANYIKIYFLFTLALIFGWGINFVCLMLVLANVKKPFFLNNLRLAFD